MESRTLQIILLAYLVIALLAAAGFGFVFWLLRTDKGDSEAKRSLEQSLSNFEKNMGLNASGVAVVMGLFWPLLLFQLMKRRDG